MRREAATQRGGSEGLLASCVDRVCIRPPSDRSTLTGEGRDRLERTPYGMMSALSRLQSTVTTLPGATRSPLDHSITSLVHTAPIIFPSGLSPISSLTAGMSTDRCGCDKDRIEDYQP